MIVWAEERNMTLEAAEWEVRPRRDRRSVFFGCRDCDQFHELMDHHKTMLDNQPHVLADNGGAILLDHRVRVIKGFNTADYWLARICQSVDLKLSTLPDEEEPEVYPYMHLSCGQARVLNKMAWDSVLSACHGKRALKRISRSRRQAREQGFDQGRPFKIGLLNHIDYGDGRKRTYIVRRRTIEPIARKFQQFVLEGISRTEPDMVS
jgi:hypothetical protein